MAWVLIAAMASYLVFEPFPPENSVVNLLVGAIFSVAFGVGSARHPWRFLAFGLFMWTCVPLATHFDTARSLSVQGSFLAWVVGAGIRWYSWALRPSNASLEDGCFDPQLQVSTSKIVSALFSALGRIRRVQGRKEDGRFIDGGRETTGSNQKGMRAKKRKGDGANN